MEEEKEYQSPEPQAQQQTQGSSARLMWCVQLLARIVVSNIEVIGKEHLRKIPADAPIIVATTHLTDLDVPLAVAALGHDLDLMVTDLSTHWSLKESLRSYDPTIAGVMMAGRQNFLPITYTPAGGNRKGQICPPDMVKIQRTLESGKNLVIAAHNPSTDGRLTDAPGYTAIRTALSVENTRVIPVAVQIGTGLNQLGLSKHILKTIIKRPSVRVILGQPLVFNNPAAKEAVMNMEQILDRRRQGLEQAEDKKRLKELRQVVNVSDSNKIYAKRIIGLPNEEIEIRDGAVYINGQVLNEQYLSKGVITSQGYYPPSGQKAQIPQDKYFILGDNRGGSSDSRSFGFVPKENIIGKLTTCYKGCTK